MKTTKANKKGKVNHLTQEQYDKITEKVYDGKSITKKERELLECMAFDNWYIHDHDANYDENWSYISGMTDSELLADIEMNEYDRL